MTMRIAKSERDTLIADVLHRLRTLPEAHYVPQAFLTTWLPMIVTGAVDGFAYSLEDAADIAPEPFHDAIRATFDWEGFCTADRMAGIARSTRIWAEAQPS